MDGVPPSRCVHARSARTGMTLEHQQRALEDEVRASQSAIAPHCRTLRDEELRACGKFYGDNASNGEVAEDPENQRVAWIRNFLAEYGQGVPQCTIEPRGIEWPEDRAYMLEAAVNQLAIQSKLQPFVHQTAIDFGFRSARAVCSLKKKRSGVIPIVRRLAFDEYLIDSTVTSRELARWQGHRVARDIDDVIEEAKTDKTWNVSVLERIKEGVARDPRSQKNAPSSVKRHELVYWVLWERDYDCTPGKDERTGHFGSLLYVADPACTTGVRGQLGVLRKPEAWFGHPDGPYPFAASMKIGDLPIELSPLVASAVQGGFANEVARAIKEAIVSYKRNGVINGDQFAGLIKAAPNGAWIGLPQGAQLSNMFAQIETGGLTAEMLAAFQHVMESAQRAAGGLGSNLGDVDSDATATAILSAQKGRASTIGLDGNTYLGFLGQVFERWAYWADMEPSIGQRVGPVPPEILEQMLEAGQIDESDITHGGFVQMRGGQSKAEDHRNLGLAVDAFSLRSKDEMALEQDFQSVSESLAFLASLGPMGLAIDADKFMRARSRTRGIKWAEKLLDSKAYYAIAATQIGAEAAQPQPTGGNKSQITFTGGRGGGNGSVPRATPNTPKPAYGGGGAKPQPKSPSRSSPAKRKPQMAGAR